MRKSSVWRADVASYIACCWGKAMLWFYREWKSTGCGYKRFKENKKKYFTAGNLTNVIVKIADIGCDITDERLREISCEHTNDGKRFIFARRVRDCRGRRAVGGRRTYRLEFVPVFSSVGGALWMKLRIRRRNEGGYRIIDFTCADIVRKEWIKKKYLLAIEKHPCLLGQ